MRHTDFARFTDYLRYIFCVFNIWGNQFFKLEALISTTCTFSRNLSMKIQLTSDILTDGDNACESESFVLAEV